MATIKTMFKLSDMPYAQATVHVYPDGDTVLVSYSTPVARMTAEGWVYINGIYSHTTGRHIKAFIREYVPEMATAFGANPYEQIKKMAMERIAINRFTGEVKDW